MIRKVKPKDLYIIADGPKSKIDFDLCNKVRSYIENNIDWECNVQKIYSRKNLGCAKRIHTGLDEVFKIEEKAIILEDDTLPIDSFFRFCNDMLSRYEDDHRIVHISGCNLQPRAQTQPISYCFTSILNIWGWATWRRSWTNFDLRMSKWNKENKVLFLSKWCISNFHRVNFLEMFDLHCDNDNPWTWDYQWVYSCWKANGLGIMPSTNLVSNIGIGPNASNTKSKVQIKMYPNKLQDISYPLLHSKFERDYDYEKRYFKLEEPSFFRKTKSLIKSFLSHDS